jgi:N-acetylglutamate synthase
LNGAEAALQSAWEVLAGALPGAWMRRVDGAIAGVSGVPIPSVNGLWAGSAAVSSSAAAAVLDEVAASGLPHCVQLSPTASSLRELARARGFERDHDLPLMRLDVEPSAPAGPLVVRRLGADELEVHWDLCARGFEAPVELFAAMITPAVASVAGVFVGEVDGTPVTTGVHLVQGDSVGVFNVATPPEHRRRGYGAALTAGLVRAGHRDGATWAWLQSSDDGFGVYERLGFRTESTWECWVTA